MVNKLIGLSEEELKFLQNVISGLIGLGSSLGIQYIKKRKSKSEEESEHFKAITSTATDNVNASRLVVEMLQEMLDEKESLFNEKIEQAATQCKSEVEKLRMENNILISQMEEKIKILTQEKDELLKKLEASSTRNKELESEIKDLQNKIEQYRAHLSEYIRDDNI